jgi:hypothetical protein
MLQVSRYHSGSLKVRAASRFNVSNFHTAFRNKNRGRKPVTSLPTSSVPHMMQVLRSFRPFLIKRRRAPTLPARTMVKECAASSHLRFSSSIRPCSSRWRSHTVCGKLGLCLGNTVPQASDFIIRHVDHEKRGNVSAYHLRSPRWDSNYLLPSYDEGGREFPSCREPC